MKDYGREIYEARKTTDYLPVEMKELVSQFSFDRALLLWSLYEPEDARVEDA
jgi:hypothetical protein